MAANTSMPSYVANVTATRQRLSGIRQRLGLEPQGTGMRQLAPSPANGPANKPGAAVQAASATMTPAPAQAPAPQGQPEGGGTPQSSIRQSPQYQDMLAQVSQFIEQVGPQQQNMIDGMRQQEIQKTTIKAGSPEAQALAPLAKFFKENGRLPNPDELRQATAMDTLRTQLGREPTQTELQLWQAKPPKGLS